MCQPSATSAIEPKIVPPTISAIIIAAVRPTTIHVRLSWLWCRSPRNTCSCCHLPREWLCIAISFHSRPEAKRAALAGPERHAPGGGLSAEKATIDFDKNQSKLATAPIVSARSSHGGFLGGRCIAFFGDTLAFVWTIPLKSASS
ncbi:hypothetical protein CHELA1G11_13301 [Hyphomicrobiales bacterium]|nr:hypothetical protein CHELA1G2_11013 [Hyphomicrobiales bacterium]CAH1670706.1 hypothetical protein CHELA1G11_13301 [Hyphomicrobiales bacterium]